mmetsp:Transcript_12589/g.36724  ORF Transcript_12589/g.36724 Transcript_12589/m.36724 type:complete len:602 (+) Transcript_12589:50-1855(+)
MTEAAVANAPNPGEVWAKVEPSAELVRTEATCKTYIDGRACGRGCPPRPAIFWPCGNESPMPPMPIIAQDEPFRRRSTWSQPLADFHDRANLDGLQTEIKDRLLELDRKLDQVAMQVGSCLDRLGAVKLCPEMTRAAGRRTKSKTSGTARSCVSDQCSEVTSEPGHDPGLFPISALCEDTTGDPTASLDATFKRLGTESSHLARRRSCDIALDAKLLVNRSSLAEKVWTFLDDPESSMAAAWFSQLWLVFIAGTVLFTLAQTMQPPFVDEVIGAVFETVFDIVFLLELITRFAVCRHSWTFVQSPYNIFDIVAVVPIFLRGAAGFVLPRGQEGVMPFALLCIVPVLRLLKMLRRFQQFHLFIRVLGSTLEALKFLLFMLLIIVLVFSSCIFIVEPRDNIDSLSTAMWLTIVTMTTVGYGDITPESSAGRAILGVLIISSVLYMAMPIGILGNAFTQVWQERDLIQLATRMHDRLREWGLTAKDIPTLFRHYDSNGDGELSLTQFRHMVQELRLGLREDRVVELFESLDKDGGGGIDCKEFLRALFPSIYHEMYSHQQKKPPPKEERKKSNRSGRGTPDPCQAPSQHSEPTDCMTLKQAVVV